MGAAVDDLGRDAVIADLMLHGWVLLRRVRRGGPLVILNAENQGFMFQGVPGTSVTMQKATERWDDDVLVDWDELSDEQLDAFMLLRAGRHRHRVTHAKAMRIKEFKDWQ